jgi:putative aldouronate transport system permease protein
MLDIKYFEGKIQVKKKNLKIHINIFDAVNYFILITTALLCIIPILHIISISFSSSYAVDAKLVKLWPVEFSFQPYEFVITERGFYTAFFVTIKRTVLGVAINMLLTVLASYPLSKSNRVFYKRDLYVWIFLISILFSGGLIPLYLVVVYTDLINTIWALVIPTAVPVFNVILLHNFFKQIPEEIEESAIMDGAGHFMRLFRIFVPLSKPALATLVLFCAVMHWNQWFDGLIYMNDVNKYPLQTYLQKVIVKRDVKLTSITELEIFLEVNQRNSNAAKIFIAMIPILMFYPFLQKYFTKGIVLGSVKG